MDSPFGLDAVAAVVGDLVSILSVNPALDPEGNPIDVSVPRVLRIRGQELAPADVDGHVASIASGTFVQPVARPTAAPVQPPAERELPDHGATTDEGEGR